MCKFFSLVSDGKGKIYYFDWMLRKQCLSGKLDYNPDSHTSIADYHGFKGNKEDQLNKYEYNPLTKEFVVDQLNTKDDVELVKEKCYGLDFGTIVPQLVIKPIINPFIDVKEVTKQHLKWLEKWGSVWYSVRGSVGDSVRDSVWDSLRDSLRDSVRDSVWYSVWDSVWYSVWYSVRGYYGSFFKFENWKNIKHKKGEYPFQSVVNLWEAGLVPSFDGKIWRLHSGKKTKIVWKGVV